MDLDVHVSDKQFRKVIYALTRLMVHPLSKDNLVKAFDVIDSVYSISKLSINTSVRLCLVLSGLTTCLLCENGSKRFYYLVLFLYRSILDKKTHDIILRFIYYANNIEYQHHDSIDTLKRILIVTYNMKVVNNDKQNDNEQIEHDTESLINLIRENTCKKSVIMTSLFLFEMEYRTDAANIDWMISSIDESLNVQNIKKYPHSIRILPILFAGTIRLSQTLDCNYPFMKCILSIVCSVLSCTNKLIDCESIRHDAPSLGDISRYDDIEYRRLYAHHYGNIDQLVGRLNDYRTITKHIFKCINIIHTSINTDNIVKDDSNCIKNAITIPSMSTYFETSESVFTNLFGSSIVFYTQTPNSISPIITNTFFCELSTTIDNNARKHKTFLIKGPINYTKTDHFENLITKLNYYINNFKISYHIKHVPFIPFFQFINVDVNNFFTDNDIKYPDVTEKALSISNPDMLMLSECISKSKSNLWMIIDDPLFDYRNHNWNVTFNDNFSKTVPVKYIVPSTIDSFFLNRDKKISLVYLYDKMINDPYTKEENAIKSLFIALLFKACIGVNNESIFEDTFVYLEKDNTDPSILTTTYQRFDQPRFASYYNTDRKNIRSSFGRYGDRKYHAYKYNVKLNMPLTTFKQKEIDFFFKEFKEIYEPIIKEIYTSISTNLELTIEHRFSNSLRKKIKDIKGYKERSKEYTYSLNPVIDQCANELFPLVGFMQYSISKVLNIDPNVYGVDIIDTYKYMRKFHSDRYRDNLSIITNWMWSYIHKTSLLTSYEENEFTPHYVHRPQTVELPISIDFVRGWIYQEGNMEYLVKTLGIWQSMTKLEIKRLSSAEKDLNDKLYPDKKWLSQTWLPEVKRAQEMNQQMYENALKGDLWDFCEFHFGRHFIRLFLDRIRSTIHFISKCYKKHPSIMKVHKKPQFIQTN